LSESEPALISNFVGEKMNAILSGAIRTYRAAVPIAMSMRKASRAPGKS
jgi:hypothetical protein